MGRLIPEDMSLAGLDDAERHVVDACVHGLSDGWLVLPDVGLSTSERDHQLDVVLVHPQMGVADLEVKGHRPEIVGGQWFAHGRRMDTQPNVQARKNAYALRERLRGLGVADLDRVEVEYAIVFPNAGEILGEPPPDLDPAQVLTSGDLDDIGEAIADLMAIRSRNRPLTDAAVTAIVAALRPDVGFAFDPNARLARSRARLDALCAEQTRVLERLDVNRRVVAVGGAGTGKTRLALAWTRRALARGERVLLTCYNDPLADHVAGRLEPDPDLVVGPFLPVALGLCGLGADAVPPDADRTWWTETAIGRIVERWHLVEDRFDTIVVDEGQDFSPAWLGLLDSLLADDGPGRLLVLADPRQDLYSRGFRLPGADTGWVRAELLVNCRNARGIASLLRRRLGGPPAPGAAPEELGLRFALAAGDDLERVVGLEIDRLAAEERLADESAVLTTSSEVRDRLIEAHGLVRWERRSEGLLCENVHRAKGLERDSVILVVDDPRVDEALLAIGVSRAVADLVVVGPAELGTRLGL